MSEPGQQKRRRRRGGGGGRGGGSGGGGQQQQQQQQQGGGRGGGGRRGGGGNKKKPRTNGGGHGQQQQQARPPMPPQAKVKANVHSRTSSTTRAALSSARFDELPISDAAKHSIATVLGYETMTKCQAESIPVSLRGGDVLCKAKTGTGKTLAFLVPSCELAMRVPSSARRGNISILIISPTRELASQISTEAKQLIGSMGLSLMTVFGGTNVSKDKRAFAQGAPDILVATPGRLNDHLENMGLRTSFFIFLLTF